MRKEAKSYLCPTPGAPTAIHRTRSDAVYFRERRVKRRRYTYLKRLDEGPEQGADTFAAVEQLDEAHDTEQTKEVDLDDRRTV